MYQEKRHCTHLFLKSKPCRQFWSEVEDRALQTRSSPLCLALAACNHVFRYFYELSGSIHTRHLVNHCLAKAEKGTVDQSPSHETMLTCMLLTLCYLLLGDDDRWRPWHDYALLLAANTEVRRSHPSSCEYVETFTALLPPRLSFNGGMYCLLDYESRVASKLPQEESGISDLVQAELQHLHSFLSLAGLSGSSDNSGTLSASNATRELSSWRQVERYSIEKAATKLTDTSKIALVQRLPLFVLAMSNSPLQKHLAVRWLSQISDDGRELPEVALARRLCVSCRWETASIWTELAMKRSLCKSCYELGLLTAVDVSALQLY